MDGQGGAEYEHEVAAAGELLGGVEGLDGFAEEDDVGPDDTVGGAVAGGDFHFIEQGGEFFEAVLASAGEAVGGRVVAVDAEDGAGAGEVVQGVDVLSDDCF